LPSSSAVAPVDGASGNADSSVSSVFFSPRTIGLIAMRVTTLGAASIFVPCAVSLSSSRCISARPSLASATRPPCFTASRYA
jgi:hypothetical protein